MKQNIIIAGGGTGGHIYPALAIAKALQKKDPDLNIHFVGSPLGLEKKIVPKEGFPLHLVPVGRLNKNVNLGERIKTLIFLPIAFLKSIWILIKLKPKFILGVGGYASAPIIFMGSLFGYKTYIWEPNAYPGLANRVLSKYAEEALVVFEAARKRLQSKSFHKVGMPVREAIEALENKESLQATPLKIFVFGGSQGAKGLNETVSQAFLEPGEWSENVQLVHQTGPRHFEETQKVYESLKAKLQNTQIECLSYVDDMDRRYAWANLIICRSGTGTISELAACGKAAVLVPFPNAADNHQQKNAEELVQAQAAQMVIQKDFTPQKLRELIAHYKSHPEELETLAKNVKSFHSPRAAENISQHLLERAKLI